MKGFLSEAFRPGRNISLSKVAEAIGINRKNLTLTDEELWDFSNSIFNHLR